MLRGSEEERGGRAWDGSGREKRAGSPGQRQRRPQLPPTSLRPPHQRLQPALIPEIKPRLMGDWMLC